jgi:oligopeptide transport system permease protein
VLGRLLGGIIVVLVVGSIAFLLLQAAPGGPFDAERPLSPEAKRNMEERYHLDDPVIVQYGRWMAGVVTGDLGPSMQYKRSVNEIIATHFPYSMKLGLIALGFALVIGIFVGVTAAARRNSTIDYSFMGAALLGVSIPSLVLGPVLQNWFAIKLGWLPIIRAEGFASYLLPGLTLGLIYAGVVARLARGGMLEVLHQDYIRTARAKGATERAVVWKHGIRLGLLPVVTYIGPATATLLSGSFVVEKIFQIPGLGVYFIDSVTNRDYTLLGGVMVFYVSILVVMNLLVDIAYGFIDPRIRDKR